MKKTLFATLVFSVFWCDFVCGTAPNPNRLTTAEKAKLQELSSAPQPGLAGQARKFLLQDAEEQLNREQLDLFLKARMPVEHAAEAPEDDDDGFEQFDNVSDFDSGSEYDPFSDNESSETPAAAAATLSPEQIANKNEWTPREYNFNRILLQIVHDSKPGVCAPAIWQKAYDLIQQLEQGEEINYTTWSEFNSLSASLHEALNEQRAHISTDHYMTDDEISRYVNENGESLLRRAKQLTLLDLESANKQEEILRRISRHNKKQNKSPSTKRSHMSDEELARLLDEELNGKPPSPTTSYER